MINLMSSQGYSYILNTIVYLTKWKEVKSLKKDDTKELISFIEENIMSLFGVPEKFITSNDSIFVGSKFTTLCGKYSITMG